MTLVPPPSVFQLPDWQGTESLNHTADAPRTGGATIDESVEDIAITGPEKPREIGIACGRPVPGSGIPTGLVADNLDFVYRRQPPAIAL